MSHDHIKSLRKNVQITIRLKGFSKETIKDKKHGQVEPSNNKSLPLHDYMANVYTLPKSKEDYKILISELAPKFKQNYLQT